MTTDDTPSMTEEEMIQHVVGRFFLLNRPPLWFLDVGVGLGREAHAMRSLCPDLNVLGLEPNPAAWRAAEGDYPGILLPFGAWSEECSGELRVSGESLEWGTLLGPDTWAAMDVRLKTLDFLASLYRGVDRAVLWIDVEGAELEVLKGARHLLGEGRVDLINLEARDRPLYPGGCTEAELTTFLTGHDFAPALEWNRHGGDDPHHDIVYVRKGRKR